MSRRLGEVFGAHELPRRRRCDDARVPAVGTHLLDVGREVPGRTATARDDVQDEFAWHGMTWLASGGGSGWSSNDGVCNCRQLQTRSTALCSKLSQLEFETQAGCELPKLRSRARALPDDEVLDERARLGVEPHLVRCQALGQQQRRQRLSVVGLLA